MGKKTDENNNLIKQKKLSLSNFRLFLLTYLDKIDIHIGSLKTSKWKKLPNGHNNRHSNTNIVLLIHVLPT